jgi:heme A synthase
VHFVHRLLAFSTAIGAFITAVVALRSALVPSIAIFITVALQIALGAWTVLSHVSIAVASLHQLNAALVLAAVVALLHRLRARAI